MKDLIISIINRINTRSFVTILLVGGAIALALIDPAFRPAFGDLAKVGVGGYLGQLLPQASKREQ